MMHSGQQSMEALPYYRWLWRDWRANRKVQRMSWQARGIYRELLDEFWAEGIIPADVEALADICGCTVAEMEQLWRQIEPCWERVDGGYRNSKLENQRTAKDAERTAKAIAGRSGGLACNSRTRAEALEASANQVQASAEELQAQPDIALAGALARALIKTSSPSASEDEGSSSPKDTLTLVPELEGLLRVEADEMSNTELEESVGLVPSGTSRRAAKDTPDRSVVERIFSYYLERLGKSPKQYALTPLRVDRGLKALRECQKRFGPGPGAEEAMGAAVDGLLRNRFLMGENEQRKQYSDWEGQVFKSVETMEKRWKDGGFNPDVHA